MSTSDNEFQTRFIDPPSRKVKRQVKAALAQARNQLQAIATDKGTCAACGHVL
jgi:hypothetical protein